MDKRRWVCLLATLLTAAACSRGGITESPDGDVARDAATSDAANADLAGVDAALPHLNLLVNPSLETWASASTANTTPDEWTNCSKAGALGVDAVPDSCMAMPSTAADGTRYARAYVGEGIQQIVSTVQGGTYVVSFQYTAVASCFGGSADAGWEVEVNGNKILSTPSDTEVRWRTAMATFVAASSSTTICFRKPTTGSGQGGIDQLSVRLQ